MEYEFSRTEMLIGKEGLERLEKAYIAVFGIGGVGSFVVEALARTGIGRIAIIDFDDISISNINRQIHANRQTVGMSKVEVMRDRILQINPEIKVDIYKELYNNESKDNIVISKCDYVVDAIDMVSSKLLLVEQCKEKDVPIISSMGAGNKLNPTMFEVSDIYETSICPLARVMRRELKKRNIDSLKVVYSKEKPINIFDAENNQRKRVPGSIAFVPSVVGLIIASEVVKDLIRLEEE
ncbi:tRNA threonylcarbamoyladenosine dehydratase [Clostridiisalibacter paucivorans]|uniref:tRNA threonylcarbamoyladenosine dehydratase n=1 Tax=Clostridiisalibacter paucivorans TaxID=408753 RepID=UPI000479A27C|nr:tRNA threonylcarbamoyladenosine dehydratase [Clostridiisalibacter paucivorans]